MANVFIVTGQTADIEVPLGAFSTLEKAESFMESIPENIYDTFMVSDMELDDTSVLEDLQQLDIEGNNGFNAANVVALFPKKVDLKIID